MELLSSDPIVVHFYIVKVNAVWVVRVLVVGYPIVCPLLIQKGYFAAVDSYHFRPFSTAQDSQRNTQAE
jgi:hypothetical protein